MQGCTVDLMLELQTRIAPLALGRGPQGYLLQERSSWSWTTWQPKSVSAAERTRTVYACRVGLICCALVCLPLFSLECTCSGRGATLAGTCLSCLLFGGRHRCYGACLEFNLSALITAVFSSSGIRLKVVRVNYIAGAARKLLKCDLSISNTLLT